MRLPFVFVNMAMTADGKIATANRAVSTFSSRRDFEHLLELRATADAVLSGARTVGQHEINLGPGPARFRRMRLKNGLAVYYEGGEGDRCQRLCLARSARRNFPPPFFARPHPRQQTSLGAKTAPASRRGRRGENLRWTRD